MPVQPGQLNTAVNQFRSDITGEYYTAWQMVALKVEYDGAIVALSTGIAFIGAFAAISLCEQYRMSTIANGNSNPLVPITLAALSFAGVGIWGMHFVAASSYSLSLDGVDVPVRFNVSSIIISLVVVIILEFAGIYVSSTDNCFNKSKKKIVEMFISRARSKYTMGQIKQMGKYEILRIVCTHNLHRIIIGGLLGGAGVILVHYLGMMSLEFQGTVKYNYGLIALSVIIALISVVGGFWVFFRVLSLFPSLDILRIVCALNGMFSLSGVHYIGLVSATYEFDPAAAPVSQRDTVSRQELLVGVLAASLVFCVLMQVFVLSDLRGWLLRTSGQLRHADQVIHELRRFTAQHPDLSGPGPAAHELLKYLRKYGRPSLAVGKELLDEESGGGGMVLYNDYSDDDEEDTSELTRGADPQRIAGLGLGLGLERSRGEKGTGKVSRNNSNSSSGVGKSRSPHPSNPPRSPSTAHTAYTAYTAYTADSHAFSFASSLRVKPTRAVVRADSTSQHTIVLGAYAASSDDTCNHDAEPGVSIAPAEALV